MYPDPYRTWVVFWGIAYRIAVSVQMRGRLCFNSTISDKGFVQCFSYKDTKGSVITTLPWEMPMEKKVINDFLKTLKENVKQKRLPKGFSVKQGPVLYSAMLLKVFLESWTCFLSKCVLQGRSSVSGRCLTHPESCFSSAGTERLKGSLSQCQKPVMKPAGQVLELGKPWPDW